MMTENALIQKYRPVRLQSTVYTHDQAPRIVEELFQIKNVG